MAETSYPSPSHNSRNVTEAEYEKVMARATDDGIYNDPFDDTPVIAGSGLQVLIQPEFYASVRGFLWESGSTEFPKTIDNNDLTAGPRQDWVVLRLDRSTWNVRVAIRKGTPAAGPPALVRDQWNTGVYEIPLALVTVPVGATNLASGDVEPYPLYVGSRVRFGTGVDEVGAAPGALRWTGEGYDGYDGTSWTPLIEDTGWATLGINGPNGSAWTVAETIAPFKYRRISQVVHLRFSIIRVGSNLSLSDADGSTPYILPIGFRPSAGALALGHGNHSRSGVQLFIYPNGHVRVYPLDSDLPAGRRVYAQAVVAI